MLLRNNFRVAGSRLGPISVRTKAFERSAIERVCLKQKNHILVLTE